MKLHILSDLHIEFEDFSPPESSTDIVVIAGDICVGAAGIEWATRQFPDLPAIYVPGNHEHSGFDIGSADGLYKAAPANAHVLSNNVLEPDGIRFLATTLRTDFRFYGEGEAWFARQTAKALLEDFTSIRNGKRRFTPEDSVELHRASVARLASEPEKECDGPAVVVTHHLPAVLSIASRYKSDALNPALASRLERLIEKYQPDLWVHGYTQVPCDYEILGTRAVCNPRGYPSESQEEFSPGLIVEL